MSFSFPPNNATNNPTSGSTAPAGGSAFGGGSGLFGGVQNATGGTGTPAPTGTPSLFGGSAFGAKPPGTGAFGGLGGAPAGTGTTGGLFGGTTTGNNTSAPAGTSLFGGATAPGAATPAGGLFGATPTPAATPSAPATGAATAGTGLFGNATASAGTTATGGLFGSTPSTTAAHPGGLFGGAPTAAATPPVGGLFGSKPAEPAKPPTSLFGAAPATTPTAANTGGLFGAKPAEATTPAAPMPPPATGGGLFSGANLFGKKDAPVATTPTAATTGTDASAKPTVPSAFTSFSLGGNKDSTKDTVPAVPAGGLFGSFGAAKPAEKKDDTAATAKPSLNLFGAAPKDATPPTDKDKKDSATAAPVAPAFSLALAKPGDKKDSAAPTGAVASTTNGVVAVPPPSVLRGKTIEEIVNRWATELETHVRDFNSFASEVSAWDRSLIANGNNLAALYNMVLAAEREQSDIDLALEHIEQQQNELAATLDVYEKSAEEVLGGQGGSLRALDTGPADTERDKNYVLATELHSHLEDLSGSLGQMIDSVNALTPGSEASTAEDPMAQIVQILSSHLESLQWIDGAVRDIEVKVGDVEKRVRDAGGASNGLGGGQSRARGFGLR